MILVNRNFGNLALSQAIGDMFKGSTESTIPSEGMTHANTTATNSNLVSDLTGAYNQLEITVNSSPKNIFIVTEHFVKVLDKVYTKIWNESFTDIGIYEPRKLSTIYHGFVAPNVRADQNADFMIFKHFVDRCITAGVLLEEDRLDYNDQIILSNLVRSQLSTYIDLPNKIISITAPNPIDVYPDIDGRVGAFHNGKKLYLMFTPYLPNYSTYSTNKYSVGGEPFINVVGGGSSWVPVKRPVAFFKPKTADSKFGRSLPMATHLIFSLGTPADKEAAIIAGTPTPDIVVDHTDRISHIDSFVLKIKFDKLQF